MKRLACALAVAGSAGALAGSAQDARAAKAQGKVGGLQLSILTPDPSNIGDQVSLDVVCKGAIVETVELYVDNALVAKRQITTSQSRNILSFKLDTLLMSAGDHDVVVKAYSPDGKSSSSSGKLRIPTLDLNAPVRIAYPQNGMQVSGVVPVRLSLDSEFAKSRPYVTFFVDKEFKVLRNTPPYEFNWDTTKTTNGWHMLEAWSQDADATSPSKARPINVNVNNGGGATSLKNGVEDLRNDKSKAIVLSGNNAAPKIGTPTPTLGGSDLGSPKSADKQPGVKTRISEPGDGSRPSQPFEYNGGSSSVEVSNPGSPAIAQKTLTPKLSPSGSGGAIKQPGVQIARNTLGQSKLPGIGESGYAAPTLSQMGSAGNGETYMARPSDRRLSTRDARPRGSFAVAFDGTQIAFDVQPRVESGVKIAPFRQIFEHTGGKLYWFGGTSQAVRAVNSSREIEIKIGDKHATVNNQPVQMERKATLEAGRTIVPLSFVRDALDVKINYDEKSGRLLIESKK
jgi:hypothetical protein